MRGAAGILIAAVTLATPASSLAKIAPTALRLCGASGCRIVHSRATIGTVVSAFEMNALRGPAAPGRYFTIALPDSMSVPLAHWVPAEDAFRGREEIPGQAGWRVASGAAGVLRRATARLEPFPLPRIVRVDVGTRRARDPGSYLRLFALPPARDRIADPAGPPPKAAFGVSEPFVAYFARIRQAWIPVNLWSRGPSPWGDGDSYVWVGRRQDLLKRDGEILRIRHDLAERIRRGLSLR